MEIVAVVWLFLKFAGADTDCEGVCCSATVEITNCSFEKKLCQWEWGTEQKHINICYKCLIYRVVKEVLKVILHAACLAYILLSLVTR